MICLNDFIFQQTAGMRKFLKSLVDPEVQYLSTPSSPRIGIPDPKLDDKEVQRFYKIIYEIAHYLIPTILSQAAAQAYPLFEIMQQVITILNIIDDLGVPGQVVKSSERSLEFLEKRDQLIIALAEAITKSKETINSVEVEQINFVYQGKNSIDNKPVFYLLTSRFPDSNSIGVVLYQLLKVIGVPTGPFIIVADMTNTSLKNKTKFEELASFFTLTFVINHLQFCFFKKTNINRYQKYLANIIVLNAEHQFAAVNSLVSSYIKQSKSQKLVLEATEWRDLLTWIPAENIVLPESSKTSHVIAATKFNTQGISQEVTLHLTLKSIVIMDQQATIVKSEIPFANMDEIKIVTGTSDLLVTTNTTLEQNVLYSLKSKHKTVKQKKFSFKSKAEVAFFFDELYNAISKGKNEFLYSFACQTLKPKKSDRILKITSENLLFLKKRAVKKRIPLYLVTQCSSPSKNSILLSFSVSYIIYYLLTQI